MSNRKSIQGLRATENTRSNNTQSKLENEYLVEFKDAKRVDAKKIIKGKLLEGPRPTVEPRLLIQTSRLACLIFEVKISSLYFNRLLEFYYSLITMYKCLMMKLFSCLQIQLDY